ncbi:MAG: fibronectin type III domain-containing protein [Deltaproteobacteria bacterium]
MKRDVALLIVFIVLSTVMALTLSGCNSCNKENSKAADKTAPTVPNGIAITAVSSSEIKVSWKPAADDSGKVKGYKVYKNGQYFKTIEGESVSDAGLTPKVKICYRISAVDEAGNESAQSTEVCAIL